MIHPLADVEEGAFVHETAKVWRWTHVRTGARIEENASLGEFCHVDEGVVAPRGCRLQNRVSLPRGVLLAENVFVVEGVIFTNDKYPRASPAHHQNWVPAPTRIGQGATLGAGAVILPVTIGRFAMVGAGAVVTRAVQEHELVYGNPARRQGYVCRHARRS